MLDIATPKGRITVEQEQCAIAIWHSNYPQVQYIETPKDKPAAIDAIMTHNGRCTGVVETKCRELSFAQFDNLFDQTWLVTLDKIMTAKSVAEGLQVPLLGFLYLVPDYTLLWRKLWCPENGWVTPFTVKKTETRATVNGGKALRDNAFIDMRNCDQLRMRG